MADFVTENTDLFLEDREGGFVQTEAPPAVEETFEARLTRLKREDYERRNLEAIKEREDILRRNKVLAPDEPFSMDPDAAVRQRCCF
jgi:hypothetical protein